MNCKDYKLLIIEDIYDEISKENKAALKSHIKSCESCQKEYNELILTVGTLKSWENESLQPTVLPFNASKPKKPKNIFYKIALSAAAILLVLSLFNFNLSFNESGFNLSFSLLGSSANIDNVAANILNNGSQLEQIQLMVNLIEESKIKQKEEMVALLTDFYQAVEMRRQADLKVIAQGMETLQSRTNQRIDDTDQVLEDLIQYTGSMLEKSVYVK